MKDHISEFKTFLQLNKGAAENTIVSYIRDVNQFNEFLYSLGTKKISDSTESDVKKYVDKLRKDGKSVSTITRAIASLRTFFTYLLSKNVISQNPTKGIKNEKKEKALPRILTGKEVEILLSQPESNSLKGCRDKAMLELLYATGIRVSELIELNITDLNTDLGFVRCGKNNAERMIPLYPAAVSAIKEYFDKSRPLLLTNQAEKALFVNLNGSRMTRQGFWKIIKHYQETAHITTEITPHTLRHSFAAHLLQNGADIGVIKEIMGHSDISSTLVYAELIKNDLKSNYIKFHPRA